jgi:hypothetical protein
MIDHVIALPVLFVVAISLAVAILFVFVAVRSSRMVSRLLLGFFAVLFCFPAVYLYLAFHPELIDARVRGVQGIL